MRKQCFLIAKCNVNTGNMEHIELLLLLGSRGRVFYVTTSFPPRRPRMKLPLGQVSRATKAGF